MPGVFDCHAHVGMSSLDMARLLEQPITRRTLETALNARLTLAAGVTFVRDAAGADAGIRDAIADGVIPGPNLQISIDLLGQTGGHGDGFVGGPVLELTSQYVLPEYPGRPPYVGDGPRPSTARRARSFAPARTGSRSRRPAASCRLTTIRSAPS
jgi:imidazolonepropionase-like amidohydrolase